MWNTARGARYLPWLVATSLLLAACAPAAPPSPTAPPAQPAEAAKPAAKPTEAPKPAAPQATAKPSEKPAAKPAAKASPVAKASPMAKAKAAFDEQAVASFYRGKTVRFIVGFSPGGGFDTYTRLVARQMTKYIPGNPTIIVENKPGASGLMAGNATYNTEPKDGTIIASINQALVRQQALGAEGIEFDVTKMHWLGSANKTVGGCAARVDSGVQRIQDTINGEELIVAADAPGSGGFDIPAVLNEALGTNFRIVPGYQGITKSQLAVQNQEAEGFCFNDPLAGVLAPTLGGDNPTAKVIVILGDTPSNHPLLQGVPPAETLARTEEARRLLRTATAPLQMTFPWVVAPEVPPDRVAALREALARTFADPAFLAEAKQANLDVDFSTGEEVQRIVQDVLDTPPAVLQKLKEILK